MKNLFLCTILLFLLFNTVLAQVQNNMFQTISEKEHLERLQELNQVNKNGVCISQETKRNIQEKIKQNIDSLKYIEQYTYPKLNSIILFEWPLKQAVGFDDCGYYTITNFVDHNCAIDQLQDYNCGNRSYDLNTGIDHCNNTGYDHAGIDIALWPFDWTKVDNNAVQVIAAAAGTIVAKADGLFDQNCGFDNPDANYIIIEHLDGSRTLYWHLKNGSVTTKTINSTVASGEYLGVVASSGSSTGPHLHFEVYDNLNNLVDPFAGPCNTFNGNTSWWTEQLPYYDSGINKIMTHSTAPTFNECPERADINGQNVFCAGDNAIFAAYYRHVLDGDNAQNIIYRPDNTIFQNWPLNINTSPDPHFSAAYWYNTFTIPNDAMPGTWTYEVTYKGQVCTHSFTVEAIPDAEFTYTDNNFCPNQSNPTPLHNTGTNGVYSVSPTGLVFTNSSTGEINLSASNPGVYTITNTVNNYCGSNTDNFSINISPVISPSFTSIPDICQGVNPPILPQISNDTPPINGTWNATVSTNTVGTSTYTFTPNNGSCANTSTLDITIIDASSPICCNAGFSYNGIESSPSATLNNTSYCINNDDSIMPIITDGNGTFSVNPSNGLSINTTTGRIIPNTSTSGTYIVTYNVSTNSGCSESIEIVINDLVSAGTPNDIPIVCSIPNTTSINLNNLLDNEDSNGNWMEVSINTSMNGIVNNNEFSSVNEPAGVYSFQYSVDGGACGVSTSIVSVEVIDPCCPTLNTWASNQDSFCDGELLTLTADVTAIGLIENTDYTVSWSGPSGNIPTNNGNISIIYSGSGCSEVQDYTIDVFCNNTNQLVAQETISVSVSPTIVPQIVNEGECEVSINTTCPDWLVIWDDGQGNSGIGNTYNGDDYNSLEGLVTFSVSNPIVSSCSTKNIEVGFTCCIAQAGIISTNTNEICYGVPIEATVINNETSDGYIQLFILTDDTNEVIDISSTGTFSNYNNADYFIQGLYNVYSYNYRVDYPPTPAPVLNNSIYNIGNNGCYALSAPSTINIPAPFNITNGDVNTNEGNNGGSGTHYYNTHKIIIEGGIAPYIYEWGNHGYVRYTINNGDISILYADNASWAVTVIDANGCTNEDLIFSTNSNDEIDIVDFQTSPDTGTNNGSISLNVAGNCPPYNYEWAGIDFYLPQGNQNINNLSVGWYSVTVSNNCGENTVGWFWIEPDRRGRGKLLSPLEMTVYPNPFSQVTNISFVIKETDWVDISIFSIEGKEIAQLFSGEIIKDIPQNIPFNANDIPHGLYLVQIQTKSGIVEQQKVLFIE